MALSQLTTYRPSLPPPQKWPYLDKRCLMCWNEWKINFPTFICWVMVKILRIVWKMAKENVLKRIYVIATILRFLFLEIWLILYSTFLVNWPKYHHKRPNYWVWLRFCSNQNGLKNILRKCRNFAKKYVKIFFQIFSTIFFLGIFCSQNHLKRIKKIINKIGAKGLHVSNLDNAGNCFYNHIPFNLNGIRNWFSLIGLYSDSLRET